MIGERGRQNRVWLREVPPMSYSAKEQQDALPSLVAAQVLGAPPLPTKGDPGLVQGAPSSPMGRDFGTIDGKGPGRQA